MIVYVVIIYNTLGCMCVGVNDYVESSMFLVFSFCCRVSYLVLAYVEVSSM